MKAGREFEKIVERILRVLEPGAEVVSPGRLPDETMDEPREIDVLVRGRVRGNDIGVLIAECRDHKKPVEVGYIEAITTKQRDVRADFALVVSAAGFTKGARQKAQAHGIDLFTLKEADLQDWSDWLGCSSVENFAPHVWVHHINVTLAEDAPDDVDLAAFVEPDKGINVMTQLFTDDDGVKWSQIEVLNRAFAQGGLPELSLDGTRHRFTIDVNVEGLCLTLPASEGRKGLVVRMAMIVDLWRERSTHPLRELQFAQVGGSQSVQYAEATLHLADGAGRKLLPLRVAFIRDQDGSLRVLTNAEQKGA